MNRLVYFKDDKGNEYVSVVTSEEYYKEILQDEVIGDIDLESIDYDFILWPTDRPLSAD